MSTNPPGMPPPTPAGGPMPVASPPRKGNFIVWVLVAFGAIFVLIAVVVIGGGLFIAHKARQAGFDTALMSKNPGLAIAKLMTAANPDVEVVTIDDQGQKITVREKKTGKTITMSFADARNGKFTMQADGKDSVVISSADNGGKGTVEIQSADGTVKIGSGDAAGKVPTWVPEYPGSNSQGVFTAQTKEGSSGSFTFKTKDAVGKVVLYYEDGFKSSGLKVTSNVTNSDGKASAAVLSAEDSSNTHTAAVIIGSEGGETTVSVTYNLKK